MAAYFLGSGHCKQCELLEEQSAQRVSAHASYVAVEAFAPKPEAILEVETQEVLLFKRKNPEETEHLMQKDAIGS